MSKQTKKTAAVNDTVVIESEPKKAKKPVEKSKPAKKAAAPAPASGVTMTVRAGKKTSENPEALKVHKKLAAQDYVPTAEPVDEEPTAPVELLTDGDEGEVNALPVEGYTPPAPSFVTYAGTTGGMVPSVLSDYPLGTQVWQDAVREGAKHKVQDLQRTYIQLGAFIASVATTRVDDDPTKPFVFTAWGYKNIYEYCEAELGLHQRKVDFLRRIYSVLFEDLTNLDNSVREQLVALDYAKVRELVSVLTEGNAQEWVEIAQTHNYTDFSKKVTEYRIKCKAKAKEAEEAGLLPDPAKSGKDAGKSKTQTRIETGAAIVGPPSVAGVLTTEEAAAAEDEKGERMSLWLYEEQAKVVNIAMNVASNISNTPPEKKGQLLQLICADYLATTGAAKPGTESFINYLEILEGIFGVQLVAFDLQHATEPKVLAGGSHLKTLAEMRAKGKKTK